MMEEKNQSKYKILIRTILFIFLFFFILVGIKAIQVSKPTPGRRDRIAFDMSRIRYVAELIYDEEESYKNLSCSFKSEKLISEAYNKEIKVICDGIEKDAGTKPIIHTSKDEYCAYIKLPGKINRRFIWEKGKDIYCCIDNRGTRAVTTTVNPRDPGFCDGKTLICPPSNY